MRRARDHDAAAAWPTVRLWDGLVLSGEQTWRHVAPWLSPFALAFTMAFLRALLQERTRTTTQKGRCA